MKKLAIILILVLFSGPVSFSREYHIKKPFYKKSVHIKAGADLILYDWYLTGITAGPNVGIAWEKWRTPDRGFITELHAVFTFGFSNNLSGKKEKLINYNIKVEVPLLWAFRSGSFAFKTGLQPNITIPVPNHAETDSGCRVTPAIPMPEIHFPLYFTYYFTKNFSIDFRIVLPAVVIPEIFPLDGSVGISVSWKLPGKK